MSYEGLAIQMKHAGCPINASALFRIEKGEPPRRITVDELVGFSQVFGIGLDQILLPPELAAKQELVALVTAWDRARVEAVRAQDEVEAAWGSLRDYVRAHHEIAADVESAMAAWIDFYGGAQDVNREWMLDHHVAELTGDKSRKQRAAEKFHKVIG